MDGWWTAAFHRAPLIVNTASTAAPAEEGDHIVPSCCRPYWVTDKAENKVSRPVWCVHLQLPVMFPSVAPRGNGATEGSTGSLLNPLQHAVYSKRIISPILWCHCKATEALAQTDTPRPPRHASPVGPDGAARLNLAISSQVQTLGPSDRRWQPLPHMLRYFASFLGCWSGTWETKGHMLWSKVSNKAIKSFVLWREGAPVWTQEDSSWKWTFCSTNQGKPGWALP